MMNNPSNDKVIVGHQEKDRQTDAYEE